MSDINRLLDDLLDCQPHRLDIRLEIVRTFADLKAEVEAARKENVEQTRRLDDFAITKTKLEGQLEAANHKCHLFEDRLKEVDSRHPDYGKELEAARKENERLTTEKTIHCAACGGVECHTLAQQVCADHSFSGCGDWTGCPYCALEAAKRENERLERESGRRLQVLINVQDYLRSMGRSMPAIVEIIKESRGLSVNESGNRKEMAEVDALSAPSPREPIMNETARNARIRARRKS